MDRRRPPPPDPSPLTANTRSFEEKYSVFASDEAARARVGVLGSDLPNGYTTVEEARRMGRALSVGPGDRLLDVGAGRGWPGSLIADEYGCDLLTADLPLNALLPARGALESRLGARLGVVCADGRRLPLGDGAFDAICHADVLCWLGEKLSVLRECARVLRPGGRLAVLVIETGEGLSATESDLAAELGPTNVRAEASLKTLVARSGLTVVEAHDVTAEFRATVASMGATLEARARVLRVAEGDEAFENEREKKERMLKGIDRGLLLRTFVVGRRPSG